MGDRDKDNHRKYRDAVSGESRDEFDRVENAKSDKIRAAKIQQDKDEKELARKRIKNRVKNRKRY